MVYCLLLLLLLFVICCCFCGEIYVGTVVFSPVHNKLMRMRLWIHQVLSPELLSGSGIWWEEFLVSLLAIECGDI